MKRDATLKQLNALAEVCVQLSAAMQAFEDVVIRENSAIARSDIQELAAITDEKIAFGEQLKSKVRRLAERMDEFVSFMGLKRIAGDDERQLSEFVKAVKASLIGSAEDPTLSEALSAFESRAEELKEMRQKLFPQIEVNAYLVKKLLQYHRETYAFWQSVADESESTYGDTGKTKQKSSGQRSILSVRT
jgi:flagellar biosynthesis/type III secretory pathway chaperone